MFLCLADNEEDDDDFEDKQECKWLSFVTFFSFSLHSFDQNSSLLFIYLNRLKPALLFPRALAGLL